jgi:hypothetical protein
MTTNFLADFSATFNVLRRERGANLVTLSALRAALPGYSRETFDTELYELRAANLFVLAVAEGRHGRPAPEVIAAGITEQGRRFVYISRRES